jgi:hypothetical protein
MQLYVVEVDNIDFHYQVKVIMYYNSDPNEKDLGQIEELLIDYVYLSEENQRVLIDEDEAF